MAGRIQGMRDVTGDMTVSPKVSLSGGAAGSMTASYVGGGGSVMTQLLDAISALKGEGGDTIIPVYIGQDRIDEIVVTAAQRANYKSGGR